MSTGALIFMLVSWTGVLGTMVWAFARIIKVQARRKDNAPDGDRRV